MFHGSFPGSLPCLSCFMLHWPPFATSSLLAAAAVHLTAPVHAASPVPADPTCGMCRAARHAGTGCTLPCMWYRYLLLWDAGLVVVAPLPSAGSGAAFVEQCPTSTTTCMRCLALSCVAPTAMHRCNTGTGTGSYAHHCGTRQLRQYMQLHCSTAHPPPARKQASKPRRGFIEYVCIGAITPIHAVTRRARAAVVFFRPLTSSDPSIHITRYCARGARQR